MAEKAQKNAFNTKRRSELTFITLSLIYPLLIFSIFYLYVNFNSILLAFKEYDSVTAKYVFASDIFVNFKAVLNGFVDKTHALNVGLKNSCIIYVVGLGINMPLQIIFSYFIWKKIPLSGFFKVIIFIPSIVSNMVYTVVGELILKFGVMEVFGRDLGLLIGTKQFTTVFLYSLLVGVGANIVYYLGTMSSTDQSVVEYGKLDGLNSFREFWHIILPHIWPTMITFMVVATSQFFTEKSWLYQFFGSGADFSANTIGYYFFKLVFSNNSLNAPRFPEGAAGGFLFTLIAVPLTMGVKRLLEKVGPSED